MQPFTGWKTKIKSYLLQKKNIFFSSYTQHVLLYAPETWEISRQEKNDLMAVELQFLREMQNVKQMDSAECTYSGWTDK